MDLMSLVCLGPVSRDQGGPRREGVGSICFFFQQTDSLFVGARLLKSDSKQRRLQQTSMKLTSRRARTHTHTHHNIPPPGLERFFLNVVPGFPGVLTFTQDIYPVVNGKLPITDEYTFDVFARPSACLSPYSELSFTLSGRLGSLNSCTDSALRGSLSWSDWQSAAFPEVLAWMIPTPLCPRGQSGPCLWLLSRELWSVCDDGSLISRDKGTITYHYTYLLAVDIYLIEWTV